VVEKITADPLIFLNSPQFKIHQTWFISTVQVVDIRVIRKVVESYTSLVDVSLPGAAPDEHFRSR
jgi:hypothetical protein